MEQDNSGDHKNLIQEQTQSHKKIIEARSASKDQEGDNNDDSINPNDMKRDGMSSRHIAAYSVGHFSNDLCATMWFVYLSWYLNKIVKLDKELTGLCMLSGQLADGITTPIVGFLSDKLGTPCGKRYPWFVAGTMMVIPCFMGIFTYPPFINDDDPKDNKKIKIWYLTLPALFNVGWASVQISHMAIVNVLSSSNRRRDRMVNNRNGFTYAANTSILTIALIVFAVMDDPINEFRVMTFTALGLGLCTSLFYICTIREVSLMKQAEELDILYKKAIGDDVPKTPQEGDTTGDGDNGKKKAPTIGKNWKGWLSEGTFYIHGLVYMFTRIAINVTMTIQPFYLQLVTGFGKGAHGSDNPTPPELALVPLISYVLSLIFSVFVQQWMTQKLKNRFMSMFVAITIVTVTSVPLIFLNDNPKVRWLVFPLAGFQGIGLAIMINTATSLISDVIGNDTANSAFVYGCYSLFDKFANGFLLLVVIAQYSDNENALRYIISIVPIVASFLSYVLTYIGNKFFSHKMAKITGIQNQ